MAENVAVVSGSSVRGMRIRIVHVDTAPDLRGGQYQLLLLARGLRERGHQQLIVCPEGSALEVRARRDGFRVLDLPAHDPGRAHGILDLRQRLLAEPADILHAHDGKGHTIAWLASVGMRLRIRRVATRRVTFSPARPWSTRLKYGRAADGVIAVSEDIKRLLMNSGVPATKIELIPDGVELPEELPGAEVRARVRARWGFSGREFVVGHMGAFAHEKGQDVAIDAIRLLAGELPRVRLVLAGSCRGRPAITSDDSRRGFSGALDLTERLREAGDRVRLLGYVDDLQEFLPGLDLYVMPSRAEGLGSSALLAMAYGVPVIASRVGGLPEIVEEEQTGWLVPPESPPLLAKAIAAAVREEAGLAQLGANARALARRYDSREMVTRTEGLYQRLLGRF